MHIAADTYIVILVTLVNLIFGLTVYLRDTKSRINVLYGLMVLAVTVWAITNYETNHVYSHSSQLIVNRLAFATGLLVILSVWVLSIYFPKKIKKFSFQVKTALVVTPISLVLVFTPWIIKNVTYDQSRQVTNIVTGPLYFIYILSVLFYLVYILINFRQSYKSSDTRAKAQVSYLRLGIILTFAWILLTSAVIPAITNNWSISKIGDLGTVFLIVVTGYAIVRHRLFDIGLVITRSLVYTLSLAVLIVVFTLSTFGLSHLFLSGYELKASNDIIWIYTIFAVILALAFGSVKKFFDRVSNQIFYRNAYDPQTFLDQLNQTAIKNIELNILLSHVVKVIQNNLKCESVCFVLYGEQAKQPRFIGTPLARSGLTSFDDIRGELEKNHLNIVSYDDLSDEVEPLKGLMQKAHYSVVVRIDSAEDSKSGARNYMCIGRKKSGGAYNTKDIKILEIIANSLVISIQNALRFEEIQSFNTTLQQRVNDATNKLRRTNEKLKALDETKDDFISMASHQLRTPLTSIKGYLSMLNEGDAGKLNELQKEMISQAFTSSQRMVYLISDMLNVSRLRTGKFSIQFSSVNLAKVIDQEISQLIDTASSRGLKLLFNKPDDFPALMLDETKIRQVIMNFIDNAIFYTPEGGQIELILEDLPTRIEFKVIDNGMGVPRSEQHHLFNKFYRAANARKARPDGTGLGLYMAKKVIIAQGGSILFDSKENKGSTFGFVFYKSKLKHNQELAAAASVKS